MGQRALNLPKLGSFAAAEDYYNNTKHWRGEYTGYKPLFRPGQRKWRQFGIAKWGDSYACKLWHTDVVTFHSDDSVTYRAWGSISTNDFANRLGPDAIRADFCHDDNMIWVDVFERTEDGEMVEETRGYSINRSIRFKRSIHRPNRYYLHEDSDAPCMLDKYKVDRKLAKQIRADLKLESLQTWLGAVASMERVKVKKRAPFESANYKYISDLNIEDMVKQGFDGWKQITEAWGYNCADRVLMACYRLNGAVIKTEIPYLVATQRWGCYNQYQSRNKRYL